LHKSFHVVSGIRPAVLTPECNEPVLIRKEVEQLILSGPLSAAKRASGARCLIGKQNQSSGEFVIYTAFKHTEWSPMGAGGRRRFVSKKKT